MQKYIALCLELTPGFWCCLWASSAAVSGHRSLSIVFVAVQCILGPTVSQSALVYEWLFLALPVCFLDPCHKSPLSGNLAIFIMSAPVGPFFSLQIYLHICICHIISSSHNLKKIVWSLLCFYRVFLATLMRNVDFKFFWVQWNRL